MLENQIIVFVGFLLLACDCCSEVSATNNGETRDSILPVVGLYSNDATNTENFYPATTVTTERSYIHNHWYSNWYHKIRDAMSNLNRRLGFTTSNVTTGLDTDRRFFYGTKEPFQDFVQAIYPGTLWCGRGNKAKFNEDLGRYNDTDFCCREHDKCPDSIRPNESKYGLENTGLFTRSHCDCDLQFYNCLKQVNSIVSRQMGVSYFNVLRPQCFRLERPVRDCAVVYRRRCILYEFENTDRLEYQWFDVPKF